MSYTSAHSLDVIVIGSALVELTPQQAGRPLGEAERFVPLPSGAAANFAIALAVLGAKVGFISRVGADELGDWLVARLNPYGIDTTLIKPVPDQLTPVSFCWADRAGHKSFYFYRFPRFSDPMGTFTAGDVDEAEVLLARVLDFTEATVRAQPLRAAALRAAAIARHAGRAVCYAVNYRPGSWREPPERMRATQKQAIAAADLVLMNEEEARLIFESGDLSDALAQASALGPSVVVATCGEAGALVSCDGQQTEIGAYSVAVRYDVGAGDWFHAGFIAGYLRGMSAPQAARLGAAAAAVKISQPASAPPPTWQQVQEFMSSA
jgi:sugar/nucleoside kinase (ribokinase family)